MRKWSSGERGFTLLELLVVIAIIGILAGVILTSVNNARSKATDKKLVAEIRGLKTALALYYDKYGYYPATSGTYSCTAGTGSNGCTPGVNVLQVLVTEGFLPRVPIGPGADGNGVESNEIYYASPGWWDGSWGYQIQFQLTYRDDTVGECNGGNCATSLWDGKYMYATHP